MKKDQVELVFENLESVQLLIKNFEYGLLKNLHTKYGHESFQLSYILIPNLSTELEVTPPLDWESTATVGDRLELKDLSSVLINGVEFETYWDYEYEDDSQYNVLQHNFLTEDGDLLITWG